MFYRTTVNGTVFLFVFSLAVMLSATAFSDDEEKQNALAYSVDDEELGWGPCPEIFPESCQIAVLQGNPAENNTDIFFKVQPGTELVKHKHTSAERMVLISGKLQVNYDGHQKEILKAGDYAYGPPELPHEATCLEGKDPCVLFIAFNLPIDVFPVEEAAEE